MSVCCAGVFATVRAQGRSNDVGTGARGPLGLVALFEQAGNVKSANACLFCVEQECCETIWVDVCFGRAVADIPTTTE
eukprot:7207951-Pyramimonas_sp.AAC.1